MDLFRPMDLFRHFRTGIRAATRSPLVFVGAVVCVALGIGSATALFSVLRQVVLEPLSYPDPEALVLIRETNRTKGVVDGPASHEHFVSWRQDARAFQSVAAFQHAIVSLAGAELPERLDAARVSDGFFETLGATPLLGRTLSAAEAQPGSAPVALISEGLWRRQFNADSAALGRTIRLNDRPVTIVGIMPASFRNPYGQEQDCWVPLWFENAALQRPGVRTLIVVARLKPGETLDSARAAMSGLARNAAAAQPAPVADGRWDFDVISLQERVASVWRAPAVTLFTGVLVVLLIACLNVATLLVAHAAERERELALHLALGAGRWHIARHLTMETLAFVLPGAMAGVLCAYVLQRLFIRMRPEFLSRIDTIGLDPLVLSVALAATCLTVALCTIAPLWQALRVSPHERLRSAASGAAAAAASGHGASGSVRYSLAVLTIAELALGVTLAAAAVIVTRDLLERYPQEQIDWQDKLTIRVALPPARYPGAAELLTFAREASAQLATLPGVISVAHASVVPYDRYRLTAYVTSTTSRETALAQAPSTSYVAASPRFFTTLNIKPIDGRLIDDTEQPGAPVAFVVTQSLARRLWPGRRAVGQPLRATASNLTGSLRGDVERAGEVVGVVPDLRSPEDPDEPQLLVYAAFAQHPMPFARLIVSAPHAAALAHDARVRLTRVDPAIVPDEVATLEEMVGQRVGLNRFYATLTQMFALIGLALAVVGTYAVTTYLVHRARYELGVRAALGASPGQLFGHVFGRGLTVIAVGLASGAVMTWFARRLIAALAISSAAIDTSAFATALAAVAAAALAAIVIAALRAARTPPLLALRGQ